MEVIVMKKSEQPELLESFIETYKKMFKRVSESLHKIKQKSDLHLHNLVDEAKEKEIALKNLSAENLEKIADYLKRDLEEATNFLSNTSADIQEWFGLEKEILEKDMLDFLQKAADHTVLAQLRFKLNSSSQSVYFTGEIAAPGHFICDHCGQDNFIKKTSSIPICPVCQGTSFHRTNSH